MSLISVAALQLDKDSMRWRGTFDCLLLHIEGGVVVRAKIVDCKTGVASGGPEVLYRHRDQIDNYRRAVATLFDLEESQVDCVIAWLPGGGPGSGPEEALPVALNRG